MLAQSFGRLTVSKGDFVQNFEITKRRLILGTDPKCDLQVSFQNIYNYHFFLEINQNSLKVINLIDNTDVFISQIKQAGQFILFPGDVFLFDDISFFLEELNFEAEIPWPQSPIQISQPLDQRLPTYIDGEKCFVTFLDMVVSIDKFPIFLAPDTIYEPLTSLNSTLSISSTIPAKKIEYIYYFNGKLLDVLYFDFLDGDYYLDQSPKNSFQLFFNSLNNHFFFKIDHGKISFGDLTQFQHTSFEKLSSDFVFFNLGGEQISLRIVDSSSNFKSPLIPPSEFKSLKFISKSSSLFFSIFLFLLLFISEPLTKKIDEESFFVYETDSPASPEKLESPEIQSPAKINSFQFQQNSISVKSHEALKPNQDSLDDFDPTIALKEVHKSSKVIHQQGISAFSPTSTAASNIKGVNEGEPFSQLGLKKSDISTRGLSQKKSFQPNLVSLPTKTLGSIDPEILRRILREYLPQFKHCYQNELLQKNEGAKGVIDLDFTINPNGKVSKFSILSSDLTFSAPAKKCVGDVLSLIDFPKPKGGGIVDVRQPLNFFAESSKL